MPIEEYNYPYSYLPDYRLIKGILINPLSDKKLQWFPEGGMLVKRFKRSGGWRITSPELFYYRIVELYEKAPKHPKVADYDILDFRDQVLIPGLYDLHFHWVQNDVRTQDKTSLLAWLKRYAWPCEAKFADPFFSEYQALHFFKDLLQNGTIGGAIFSSLHEHSLHHAFKFLQGRFVAGQAVMAHNSPSYLQQSEKMAAKEIKKLSEKYQERYAFTPRFALSVSPHLMKLGAELAKKNKNFIQTHLSETKEEIEQTLKYYRNFPGFEEVKNYTQIYDRSGILGAKTILAHAIYLEQSEYKILGQRKCAVAVCPTSNGPLKEGGLGSGLCSYQNLNQYKIPWALASDIGAGPYVSMLDVMRSFVNQHRKKGDEEVNYGMALHRSTLASSQILKIQKEFGNFAPGKRTDFLVLDFPKNASGLNGEEVLTKIIESKKRRRDQYQDLVKKVFLGGFRKA